MTNMPGFSYQPIEVNSIRLLKFLKSDNEDCISGIFQTFLIAQNAQLLPPYTTLSYVWSLDGSKSPKSGYISIDGGQLAILDSLQPFFEVLKAKEILDRDWWWIDSICINQEDDVERSNQVKLMNSIYTRAGSTTVWLGNSSNDSDKAMDFIGSIRKLTQEVDRRAIQRELERENYASHWKALESLLVRRWWSRIWTMQEFILSRRISFWCGLKTVNRAAVNEALWFFYLCRPAELHSCAAFINGWHRRRIHEWYQKASIPASASYFRISLAALASYCSYNNATDDKDFLYGVCALTPDIQLINIDYSLTVEEVYTNFTKSHIKHYESLDIICFAHLYDSIDQSSLPSWVPDWRKRLPHNFVVPLMVSQSSNQAIGNFRPPQFVKNNKYDAKYTASGSTKPSFQVEDSYLIARGFVLDVIDELGGGETSEIIQPSEPSPIPVEESFKSSEEALDCLSSLVRCLTLGRRDRYLQNSTVPKSFLIDIWKFCSGILQNKYEEVPAAFQNWFERNKLFRIRGCSLKSIIEYTLLDTQWSLECENSISVMDPQSLVSFTGRFHDTIVRISRSLMVSKDNGLLGTAPDKAQKGDLVCILFGCSVPVVLRKAIGEEKFVFIGECFVDGYMSGEAVGDEKFQERGFCIS